jgi:hypothetical protein
LAALVGATIAYHDVASDPGDSHSISAGTSGQAIERFAGDMERRAHGERSPRALQR